MLKWDLHEGGPEDVRAYCAKKNTLPQAQLAKQHFRSLQVYFVYICENCRSKQIQHWVFRLYGAHNFSFAPMELKIGLVRL